MTIRIKKTTPYLQESRDIQIGDDYGVYGVGKRADDKGTKGEVFYVIEPNQGNYIAMYASEVTVISSND